MKKFILCNLCVIVFGPLLAVQDVSAGNWNTKISSQSIGNGKIPIFGNSNIEVVPNFKILTDVDRNDYKYCSESNLDRTGRPIKHLGYFKSKYRAYFEKNYSQTFDDIDASILVNGKEEFSSFEDGLINYTFSLQAQNHACLSNPATNCGVILDLVTELAEAQVASEYNNGVEKTDIPFQSIQKFLIPTLIAYSSAVQALGIPENHQEIGRWFSSAISANVYDVKRGKAIDFFRSKKDLRPDSRKFGCFKAAHNHSLQSGFLVMSYGILWGDQHSFNVGIDQLQTTLKSVRNDGALPCEVTRGSNSLFYSGATIHTMLQMLKAISLQGIDIDTVADLDPLHRAVKFQIDSGVDGEGLNTYTSRFSENTWCTPYQNISDQCMYQRPKRNAAFGWIQLYRNLFPEHQNTQLLRMLQKQFTETKIDDPVRRMKLNAMFQPNQIKSQLRLNYIDIIEPWENGGSKDDQGMVHFNDTGDWSRGSPLCLYGLTDQTQLSPTSHQLDDAPPEAKAFCSNALGQWKRGDTTGKWIDKAQSLGLDQYSCQRLLTR